MPFIELTVDLIGQLESIVGQENVRSDAGARYDYSHDKMEDYSFSSGSGINFSLLRSP